MNDTPDSKNQRTMSDPKWPEDLLKLQLASADPAVRTFCSVVSRLEPGPLKTLFQAMSTNPKLKRVYDLARFNFAEVADPQTRAWRIPSKHDVVHELFLDLPSIRSIYSTRDGQRFCVFSASPGQDPVIYTFMEYEIAFNGTVHQRLRKTLKGKIAKLNHALKFTEAETPQVYHLTVGSQRDELAVDVVDVVAYTEDGVQDYVKRNQLHILEQSHAPAVFEDGRYRGSSRQA